MPTPASPIPARKPRWPNRAAIWFISRYKAVTKNKAHKCLHWPTCSSYGVLAYEKYGFWRATRKTMNRLRQCHPFSTLPFEDYP